MLLNEFFQLSLRALVAKIQPATKLCDGAEMAIFCFIFASCISNKKASIH